MPVITKLEDLRRADLKRALDIDPEFTEILAAYRYGAECKRTDCAAEATMLVMQDTGDPRGMELWTFCGEHYEEVRKEAGWKAYAPN